MKSVHDLPDRGGPIPPMHVQDIDVRGAQFLERCLDGDVEGLCVIPGVIHLVGDFVLSPLEIGCVLKMTSAHYFMGVQHEGNWTCLGCNDQLVSDASLLSPLADKILGSLVPTDIGFQWQCRCQKFPYLAASGEVLLLNANSTYAEIEVGIKEFERALFIHGAHAKFLPFVANAHGSWLDGRDAHTSKG
jgi:hypothetical protein